jgi:hypothetical protein
MHSLPRPCLALLFAEELQKTELTATQVVISDIFMDAIYKSSDIPILSLLRYSIDYGAPICAEK